MKDAPFAIAANRPLTSDIFELTLQGDATGIAAPGQFAELSVPGHFLRRPISIADWTQDSITLLIRAVGAGTAWLEGARQGQSLDIILPLGNGFDTAAIPAGADVILAGGGIGIAPLYALAKALAAAGRPFRAALGFRNAADIFYIEKFATVSGSAPAIATEDGSCGTKGFVTDLMANRSGRPAYVLACGPTPMLRAIAGLPGLCGGQFSLEARMGCGFGACMGCTIRTAKGPARICHEGPVFKLEDLTW